MTIEQRIDARVAELSALIAKHDRASQDARTDAEKYRHADMARGYAQGKTELLRIKLAADEARSA